MTIVEFIEELKRKRIEITFANGKIRYTGPEENITPGLLDNIRLFKGKLIKHFWPAEFTNMMPINTEGTRQPIFIVHGDNSNYILSEYLGPDQPVYGYFHPGSEGEGIGYNSVEQMAKIYLDMLLNVCPQGPYYLVGYSFGGLLAYEIAAQLVAKGNNVPFLVIIDTENPQAKEPNAEYGNIFTKLRMTILRPVRRSLKRNIKLLICNLYLAVGKPIPVERRSYYMWTRYRTLKNKYYPHRIGGEMMLVRLTENVSKLKYLGWESLVDEVHLTEISGHHLEVFIGEERKDILTSEIGKYLDYVNRPR